MTNLEFSNEFDILYNNIMSNQAPGLNEYKKSVFLTEAQNIIVKEVYSGRNNIGISFESSEEARRILHNLVVDKHIPITSTSIKNTKVELPEDIMFIIYEDCTLENGNTALVVPTKYDNLYDTLKNPFKRPSKDRVLRIDSNPISLYSGDNKIKQYNVSYVRIPTPIILEDLEGVSINNKCEQSECELHESIHLDILQRAVAIAKDAYTGS